MRQCILDVFVENTIPTVDRRNGCDKAKIRQDLFGKLYKDLTLPDTLGPLEKEKNKRGTEFITCKKRILTNTLDDIQCACYV